MLYNFIPSNFEAHGVHFSNTPVLFWSFIAANIITFIAYTGIPILLLLFVRKRKDLVFQPTFIFFALFIVLCGLHHLLHVITFWYPIYGIEALNDAAMAAVSIGTFFSLFPVLRQAIQLISPAQYEKINEELALEIKKRRENEQGSKKNTEELTRRNQELEEKSAELRRFNELMTGRELKMVELKKENEALRRTQNI